MDGLWGGIPKGISTIVLGDSVAKAGYIPDILGDNVYNMGCGGISAVEGYYILSNYIETQQCPETVFLSFAPFHLMTSNNFWGRSMYFHSLGYEEYMEIMDETDRFNDTSDFASDNPAVDFIKYSLYSPDLYSNAFAKGLLSFSRYKTNKTWYVRIEEDRGHSFYADSDCHGLNRETEYDGFESSDFILYYYEKIIQLCEQHGIRVIIETMPMNESSYNVIDDGSSIIEEYISFLKQIKKKYPDCIVNPEWSYMEDEDYSDGMHLNMSGAMKWSNYIKRTYGDLIDE